MLIYDDNVQQFDAAVRVVFVVDDAILWELPDEYL